VLRELFQSAERLPSDGCGRIQSDGKKAPKISLDLRRALTLSCGFSRLISLSREIRFASSQFACKRSRISDDFLTLLSGLMPEQFPPNSS
jgi:hypothetical protein